MVKRNELQSEIDNALVKARNAKSRLVREAYLELAFAAKRQKSWLEFASIKEPKAAFPAVGPRESDQEIGFGC